ncbi:MAG TPA: hypothetical protein VGF70_06295 [Solirubrobacteraceae bacterium]
MPRRSFRTAAVGAIALLAVLALPTSGWAGGPGKWTKLAQVDTLGDTFGMLRTGNGVLHLVWLKKRASNNKQSYGTSSISLGGKLLATGTALANWDSLAPDPRLVRDGKGLRLIFEGSTGNSGCFFDGTIFTETSASGSSWSLVHGSMSLHTAGVGNLAATTESDGTTPVAAFAGGHFFHVGVDPNCPAASPDGTITPTPPTDTQSFPAMATDARDGSVWVAWFQTFTKQGFWVERILPTQGAPMEAPGSVGTALKNNQPLEPVALTARAGGGIYMAYCASSASQPCAHIDLWKVGAKTARVVPGSKNTTSARLALAASPQGRVAVAWFDAAKEVIHMVRTNMIATAFGAVQTIKAPAATSGFNDIQADGSSGRVDVVITDQLSTTGIPIDLFHTQILPGLTLRAKPKKFSHRAKGRVTFTVTDAGDPLAGVAVSCLGKKGSTAANGQVKLAFPKGTATGKHVCSAGKSGYHGGKVTIKVT